MNINKFVSGSLDLTGVAMKKLAAQVSDADFTKDVKSAAHSAQELAGNYGKASAQLSSNTIPAEVNEVSELDKIFARLEQKGRKVINFSDNQDEMEVILFKGKHHDYFKARDGKVYRVRYSKDDELNNTLIDVAKAYNERGIKVPKMFTVNINGKRGVASELMTDLVPKETNPKECYKLFGLDVIFGTRNAYSKGATMLNKEGEVIRVSTSGSCGYRVRGEKRPDYTEELTELRTFLDPRVNPESAEFLKDMTREDMLNSIEISHKGYINYSLGEVARKRYQNLGEFWMRAKLTPQKEGESLLEYVTRVQELVKEVHRENSIYTQKLKEIVESYPTDGEYCWNKENAFTNGDKRIVMKFVEEIANWNDIPKAIYERRFSREEMLELAKMQLEKDKDINKNIRFIYLNDEPEIQARMIYSQNRVVQSTISQIEKFSRNYSWKRVNLSGGQPGKRTILDQDLINKYYRNEISFDQLHDLSDITPDAWAKFESRKLFEPIAGRKTPLRPEMGRTLANLDEERYQKILSRPEVLQDMPYRSKPLESEMIYEILKLDDEQYQRVLRYHLLDDKYPGAHNRLFEKLDIESLAKMSDEDLDVAISRGLLDYKPSLAPKGGFSGYNSQLSGYEISVLAKLPEEQFNNLVERGFLSGKYDYFERDRMLKTADFSKYDLETLKIWGISTDFSYDTWNPEQLRKILQLPNKHRIGQLQRLNPQHPTKKSFGSPVKLLDLDEIIKFAQLPEEAYNRAMRIMKDEKLLNGIFKDGGVYEASLLDEKGWDVLRKRGLLDIDNPKFAHMRDLLYGYIDSDLAKEYPNNNSLTLLSKIPDDKWEQFIRDGLLSTSPEKGQFSGLNLFKISKFTDEEYDRLIKTNIFKTDYNPAEHHDYPFEGHHHFYQLENIVKKLSTEEIENLAKYDFFTRERLNSYSAAYSYHDIEDIKYAANFSQKQFENFYKLRDHESCNGDDWLALQASKRFTTDEEIKRIIDRRLLDWCKAFDGENGGREKLNNLIQFSKLTDKEWEFVRPLVFEYGVGPCRYLSASIALNPGKSAARLVDFVGERKNIYEFSFKERRKLLNLLIHSGGSECSSMLQDLVPKGTIIPRTFYRRNILINELIESVGASSKKLTDAQIKEFYNSLNAFSKNDSGIMTTNFDLMSNKLANSAPTPKLLYSRDKFVNDVYEQIKDLSDTEQKKIFNYFSFDIEKDANGKLNLVGYPNPAGKAGKLGEYDDETTKKIIKKITPYADKFINGNKVFVEGNPQLERELNKIVDVFPEFLTLIGKVQHKTHDFSVDIHTLKVLQGVMKDPRYEKLGERDKLILQISTLLHDLTKAEGMVDKAHPADSAFDAYYIINRLNLPREDKLKIYEIIKNHDWLEKVNGKVKISENNYRPLTPEEYKTRVQQTAFAHRQNQCFDMSAILAKADLKGVKADDVFYQRFASDYEKHLNEVQKLINKIKETAIHIPQTRIPKASEIIIDNDIAKEVTYDGIKNTVISLKPGQDLSKIGFDKGVTSDELNMIVHALDAEEQATVFRALGIVDSDALLSSSWVNYGKGNYKVFRGQGFVLKVDSDDIHAGTYRDFGSGYKKDYDTLLNEYLFGSKRANIRSYWSDTIKEKFGFNDEEYKQFYEGIKNKPFNRIKSENPQTAQKLQEIIDEMDTKRRAGGRNYNEWLISRPEIQAGFFWGKNSKGEAKTIKDVPVFIREYCAQNNILIIFFGE